VIADVCRARHDTAANLSYRVLIAGGARRCRTRRAGSCWCRRECGRRRWRCRRRAAWSAAVAATLDLS
jgi:hypothetical protein